MTHDDGGQAFPSHEIDYRASAETGRNVICDQRLGLSLWDHYFGLAMQGLLADSDATGSRQSYVESAAAIADAMIQERKKRMGGAA